MDTAGVLDLLLPLECGGCGAPATRWCAHCAAHLAVGPDLPRLVDPRVDPGVPVFALGRYAGPRRAAIIAVKERGRTDLVTPLATALAGGLARLLARRLLSAPAVLVPAPTRRSAARRRGGDPVTRIATAALAAHPRLTVQPALRTSARARDSAGLAAGARQRNIAGRVVLRRRIPGDAGEVLLIDDVLTTGATAAESVRILRAGGAAVAAVLVLAAA